MNRIGKRIAAIALGLLIGLGFLMWRAPTPPEDTEGAVQGESDKKVQRRTRKGPRKPPPLSQLPSETPSDPDDTKTPPDEDAAEAPNPKEEALAERKRKREEYHEHLDAIGDPDVAELTMLGEMAFDAGETADAYEHYLEVIEEHPTDPQAPFALYKLAWAEYNLGDVNAAIDDMELMMEWLGDSEDPLHEMLRSSGSTDLHVFDKRAD
jgi:tetratricopeptide (TPR) repeat protein